MEATIKQINISTNVSIIIDALKAIIQRFFKQIKNRAEGIVTNFSVRRLYRLQLRMEQSIEKAVGEHPVITDAALLLMGIAIVVEIVMFC